MRAFLRPTSETDTRRGCFVALALVFLLCVVVREDPFHIVYGLRWGREPFDGTTWKANSLAGWRAQRHRPARNPRCRMVYSLFGRHRLVGMTRSAVLDLLGPPDERVDSLSWSRPGDRTWVYYLGSLSHLTPDEDILVLRFGTSGVVAQSYIDSS
jgi:hypothetical protein